MPAATAALLRPFDAPSSRHRLLTTKLSAPRLRPSLVARPGLLDLIVAADAPVTLVCAPAGYGKSTLVTHWLIQSGLSPAWISLDAYDNDPLDFFALVAAAIQKIDPATAAGTQALLDGRDPPSAQAIVRSLLEDIAAHATAQGRYGDLVEFAILQALAHKDDGDQTAALSALGRALAVGEPGGYVRTFADEGEAVAPLLRHAAARSAHREYSKRLLAAIEGLAARPFTPQSDSLEALSEREGEIMRLVAAGLSNRDIGQRLFISEKTVKKHMSNILGKLGAANRTQAVDQARKLGLV
ncbi:MAG TPA: LuxR C-terminal-related transcriptional regulator [Thermomicrobiales bacterium]|jgi:ATP/maltotriose-dependent transcriptional regulator MalT